MLIKYRSKFHAFLSRSFCNNSESVCAVILIILFSIRYLIPEINSSSVISLLDHHPALFLTQAGIVFNES